MDGVELVMAVEKAFDIRIQDAELERASYHSAWR
jgi:acyl carrier protein